MLNRLGSPTIYRSVTTETTALLRVLDLLDEGIALLDDCANILWANSVFASAVRADTDCDRILTAARQLAATVVSASDSCSMASPAPQARLVTRADVRTRIARYALRATWLGPDAAFMERAFDVVVSMHCVTRHLPDAKTLASRFGLTPCEASVTLLLACGMSNRDIAHALAISAHTARHHTENVLLKLGIHTRAAVARVVLDADVTARPEHAVTTRPRVSLTPRR